MEVEESELGVMLSRVTVQRAGRLLIRCSPGCLGSAQSCKETLEAREKTQIGRSIFAIRVNPVIKEEFTMPDAKKKAVCNAMKEMLV